MIVPIYANEEHKNAVETYLAMCDDFVQDVSTKNKYNSYQDVLQIILEYHNNYGEGNRENNYWAWLMIIPINVTVMTNGFFAGIETKGNAAKVRAYRVVLSEMLENLVAKIEKIEPVND
tara:strand:- start:2451 stop:2807 length:357 start_codon:yes stop_codon:yes gene_type:complete